MADTFAGGDDQTPGKTEQQSEGFGAQESTPFLKVGDREFKDSDAVVINIANAQTHIGTLEKENAALRDAVEALKATSEESATVKELLASLKAGEADEGAEAQGQTGQVDTAALVQQVVQQVSKDLTAGQQAAKAAENFQVAEAAAKTAFGEGYLTKVKEKADELGMTLEEVDTLARRSPKAFSRLIVGESKQSTHQPNQSSVRQQGNDQQQSTKRVPFMRMSSKERAANIAERLAQANSN